MLARYRNISALLLAIFAQLILLAYQVKNAQDVPMIRVWAVSAVTPLAKVLEVARSGTVGFFRGYVTLRDTHEANVRMKSELDRLKMENQYLKSQLSTADRVRALAAFQTQTPSRTLAARIIGMGAGSNSSVVFIDRGSTAGVEKGMAVVTPDGIVGKVVAAYPISSQVVLITDPNFAAGVISQKNHVRGTLKGQGGYRNCSVDYVQNEEKVDVGEWFYTSGDDRIFPKGFPVGTVRVVNPGKGMQEIYVEPSGLQHGLEEVLVLIEGVHQVIPDVPPSANAPMYLAPRPPAAETPAAGLQENLNKTGVETDADRLRERYKEIGQAQGHKFGEGTPGSKPPDFNMKLPAAAGTKAEAAKPGAAVNATAPEQTKPSPGIAAAPEQKKPSPGIAAAPGQTAQTGPGGRPAPPAKPPQPAPQPKPTKPVDPFL